MKSKGNLLTAILVGVVGILLISFKDRGDLLSWIAVMLGVMIIVPSAYTLFSAFFSKNKGAFPTSAVISAFGALILGICMCAIPSVFVGIFIYVFAGLLILGGIYHLVFLGYVARAFKLSIGFYIIPIVLILTGIVILCTSVDANASMIVLITGIGFLLFSVNSISEYIAVSSRTLKE